MNDFPSSYRFILGDRLIATALDLVEGLIEASHRRDKRQTLETVSVKLDRLRFLVRLSKDLKLSTLNRYEYAARAINEVGGHAGRLAKAAEWTGKHADVTRHGCLFERLVSFENLVGAAQESPCSWGNALGFRCAMDAPK